MRSSRCDASGTVTLSQGAAEIGAWSFAMEPDRPPEIALSGAMERGPAGETKVPYEARDDYGIAGARAEIALDLEAVSRRYGLAVDPEARPPLVADLPMPLSGGSADVVETLIEDFSKHPFAGLPVTVRLTAEDATGQTGESATAAGVLPMRSFYDPFAAALIEQRRDLLWSVRERAAGDAGAPGDHLPAGRQRGQPADVPGGADGDPAVGGGR